MITLDKLKIYSLYKGDCDMFARTGRPHERSLMPNDDWHLIELLLQDANVLDRNLGSEHRNREASERLRSSCSDEEVVRQIRSLADKL